MRIIKRCNKAACILLTGLVLLHNSMPVKAAAAAEEGFGESDLSIQSASAVLMEVSTGRVIYEKNPDQALSPASITKIMTLILIFDALESGKIQLKDEVTTSAYAKSMGGSQVFLEEGEIQTVETLIKCIVIASGNDASVAMAEYISGSEQAFVASMNERAKELGMENTHFEDCCGLTDSSAHVSSAEDVALMSRELVSNYPEIYDYSTIWMENIMHVTNKGAEEFCLSNTNKLLKTYNGAKGLKTGSTSLAKYCLSATAIRDDVHLIAVIMAAPDYKTRFEEAAKMLDYGFANCSFYKDDLTQIVIPEVAVKGSIEKTVRGICDPEFSYLCMKDEDAGDIKKEIRLAEQLEAPVKEGEKIGSICYTLNGSLIGELEIRSEKELKKADYMDYIEMLWGKYRVI